MTHFRSFTENMAFFPLFLLVLQRFVQECSLLQSVRWRKGSVNRRRQGNTPAAAFHRLICLFAAVQSVQERDDLCTGAGLIQTKQRAADVLGNALLGCPLDRIGVVCAVGYISKCRCTDRSRRLGRTIQEGNAVRTGADVIRAEGGIGRTVSDAILDCPCDCLGIILVSRHIVKVAQCTRFRRTCLSEF